MKILSLKTHALLSLRCVRKVHEYFCICKGLQTTQIKKIRKKKKLYARSKTTVIIMNLIIIINKQVDAL